MKIKSNLKLRRIGNRHMIVEVSDSCVNLTNVYSLNGTAARLWRWSATGKAVQRGTGGGTLQDV